MARDIFGPNGLLVKDVKTGRVLQLIPVEESEELYKTAILPNFKRDFDASGIIKGDIGYFQFLSKFFVYKAFRNKREHPSIQDLDPMYLYEHAKECIKRMRLHPAIYARSRFYETFNADFEEDDTVSEDEFGESDVDEKKKEVVERLITFHIKENINRPFLMCSTIEIIYPKGQSYKIRSSGQFSYYDVLNKSFCRKFLPNDERSPDWFDIIEVKESKIPVFNLEIDTTI